MKVTLRSGTGGGRLLTQCQPLLWLVAAAMTNCAVAATDLILTESDDGTTVTSQVGQAVIVRLAGNPSTGYAWVRTEIVGDSLAAQGEPTFESDAAGLPGQPGVYSFRFTAQRAGLTRLGFIYRRSWEPTEAGKPFSLAVSVSAESVGPPLTISLAGDRVVLSWPATGNDGFWLEGTRRLEAPAWAALNVWVSRDGDRYTATLATAETPLYLRLRR